MKTALLLALTIFLTSSFAKKTQKKKHHKKYRAYPVKS